MEQTWVGSRHPTDMVCDLPGAHTPMAYRRPVRFDSFRSSGVCRWNFTFVISGVRYFISIIIITDIIITMITVTVTVTITISTISVKREDGVTPAAPNVCHVIARDCVYVCVYIYIYIHIYIYIYI